MPFEKKSKHVSKAERENKAREKEVRIFEDQLKEEIYRLYGVRVETITCFHCALNLINDDGGYISDSDILRATRTGRLITPLSFESKFPTPEELPDFMK